MCGSSRGRLQVFLSNVGRRHDTAENVNRHVSTRIVRAADCLCNVVRWQKSKQVANQEDGVVRETVRKFLDSFPHFTILEVAQTSIEVTDFLASVNHQIRDLLRSEPDPPEHALLSFTCECFVKHAQAVSV